jgi:hypothetical protein
MLSKAAGDRNGAPTYSWRALIALLLFAAFVRGGVLLAWQDRLAADPDAYRQWARSVAMHGEYTADGYFAYRPPLYPLLLVATGAFDADYPLLAARWHLIFGVLTVWETARLGVKLRLGNGSLLGGALVAVDPILLNQSALIMTETLATLLAVAALDALAGAWERPSVSRGLWCGVVLALCCLCRPTFLPFAALATLALLALRQVNVDAPAFRRRLLVASSCAVMLVSVLSFWAVRNYQVLGKPIVGTTHGGYTLYLGNNRLYYASLRGDLQRLVNWPEYNARFLQPEVDAVWRRSGVRRNQFPYGLSVWIAPPGATPYPEVAADDALYGAALDAIANDPGGFARACLYRLRRFWGLVPIEPTDRPELRYAIGAWYLMIFAFAVAGLWQLRRSRRLWQTPWLFGVLLSLTFMAVHTVYWTDMRMRAPITPVIYLAAIVGTQWPCCRWRGVASPQEATT